MMQRCTCGPHPRVDLTAAYRSRNRRRRRPLVRGEDDDDGASSHDDDDDDVAAARRGVAEACTSHGCFHAVVRFPPPPVRRDEDDRDDDDRDDDDCDDCGGGGGGAGCRPLAGTASSVGRGIESLFSSPFLRRAAIAAASSAPAPPAAGSPPRRGADRREYRRATDDDDADAMRDGGCLAVPFPPPSAIVGRGGGGAVPRPGGGGDGGGTVTVVAPTGYSTAMTATFRGRIAEGGDGEHPLPEPKLSWEFRRCRLASSSSTTGAGAAADPHRPPRDEVDDDMDDIEKEEDFIDGDGDGDGEIWGLLPTWTEALHTVASVVIDLLGIPPNVALAGEGCRCRHRTAPNGEGADSGGGGGPCNVDLLRAFRYDAVGPEKNKRDDDDDDDGQKDDDGRSLAEALGSSPHTDWGTLTVVWQDDRGGLQTHCRTCDAWSDVDASPPSSYSCSPSKSSNGGGECAAAGGKREDVDFDVQSEFSASFFVHVGDFLSLAAMAVDDDGGGAGGRGGSVWPSPRHRVLCPAPSSPRRRDEGEEGECNGREGEREDCRRSLVYFAYPPPGISLDDVRRVVAPLLLATTKTRDDDPPLPPVHPPPASPSCDDLYDRYSLLRDQSRRPLRDAGGVPIASSSAAARAHSRIRGMPFDRVIMEKWDQVQRAGGD